MNDDDGFTESLVIVIHDEMNELLVDGSRCILTASGKLKSHELQPLTCSILLLHASHMIDILEDDLRKEHSTTSSAQQLIEELELLYLI